MRFLWMLELTVGGTGAQDLDTQLAAMLSSAGFTGTVGSSIETRLGRPIHPTLANLGRLLFFDKIHALHDDNTCAGCHSPTNGFGDTQSIAIGIQNNNLVGPNRQGPRNQRRTPMVANVAFFPGLMWNERFFSVSGDPFDNSGGFVFPPPEGATRFPPHDPVMKALAQAQGEMPPTKMTEVGQNEDFGLEQITGNPADRYKFRSSPLRNVALQPAYFHNRAFTWLEDAFTTICMYSSRRGTTIRIVRAWTRT